MGVSTSVLFRPRGPPQGSSQPLDIKIMLYADCCEWSTSPPASWLEELLKLAIRSDSRSHTLRAITSCGLIIVLGEGSFIQTTSSSSCCLTTSIFRTQETLHCRMDIVANTSMSNCDDFNPAKDQKEYSGHPVLQMGVSAKLPLSFDTCSSEGDVLVDQTTRAETVGQLKY